MRLSVLVLSFFLFGIIDHLYGQERRFLCTATTPAGIAIPFRLGLAPNSQTAYLHNGREALPLPLLHKTADTLVYTLAVFDAELRLHLQGNALQGYYVRLDARQGTLRIPVRGTLQAAQKAQTASPKPPGPKPLPKQSYDVVFADADGTHPYPAVAHLQPTGPASNSIKLAGTFETPTGDYRFLEGERLGDSLWLSTFDGGHLFLFTARTRGDSLVHGRFYGTGPGYEVWQGRKNAAAHLPDGLQILKTANQPPVQVVVTDSGGQLISLADPQFLNKPVVLQVMGTWCPNCMDETQFLTAWYQTPARGDAQVLGLAFERKPEPAYWRKRLARVAAYQKVPYALGYAGTASKDSASAVLPFVPGGIKAFPTSIFLNRKHQVVAVHSGFAGPATGAAFVEFKTKFNELILNILK